MDDDPEILGSLAQVLEEKLGGARILVAQSGAEALEILKTERPGVIITDYRMPQMNGVELLRRAKATVPHARGIVISAYAETSMAYEALREANAMLIAKPFQVDYFVQLVATLLRQGRI